MIKDDLDFLGCYEEYQDHARKRVKDYSIKLLYPDEWKHISDLHKLLSKALMKGVKIIERPRCLPKHLVELPKEHKTENK